MSDADEFLSILFSVPGHEWEYDPTPAEDPFEGKEIDMGNIVPDDDKWTDVTDEENPHQVVYTTATDTTSPQDGDGFRRYGYRLGQALAAVAVTAVIAVLASLIGAGAVIAVRDIWQNVHF